MEVDIMSLTSEGMGAADLAAITRGNDGFGFGGDGAWQITAKGKSRN